MQSKNINCRINLILTDFILLTGYFSLLQYIVLPISDKNQKIFKYVLLGLKIEEQTYKMEIAYKYKQNPIQLS